MQTLRFGPLAMDHYLHATSIVFNRHMTNATGFESSFFAPAMNPGPVYFSDERRAWIVTRYDDIMAVLRDNKRYSAINSIEIAPFDSFRPEVRSILSAGYPRFPGMIELDPPDHTRFRNLVNKAFTPRRVAELEPRIKEVVNAQIDGFGERGPIDFVERFAFPLPMTLIGRLVGANPNDADKLRVFTNNFRTLEAGLVNTLPLDEQLKCAELFVQFQRYVARMIDEREDHPTDDLTTALMQARMDDGTALNLEQLISMVIHLLFAGQETTVMLLSSMMMRLLATRELWDEVVRRPEIAPTVVEEALRFDAPVTYHSRKTTTKVELGGALIPAGEAVQLVFDAGNRDAAAFPDPTEFKVGRADVDRHLSFGRGIHFCVGAPLARLEARVALHELGRRLPTLHLDPLSGHRYTDHQMLHSLQRLMVDW